MVLNLLPAFYLLGWDFLVQMFYKQMLCTSWTCSGQNGTTRAGVKWAHHVQVNSPALPDFIDETETTKENRPKGNYNYFFTIRKFALYVSYAQINQPFIKIIFYIIQMYTTRVWRKLFKAGSVTRVGGVSVA